MKLARRVAVDIAVIDSHCAAASDVKPGALHWTVPEMTSSFFPYCRQQKDSRNKCNVLLQGGRRYAHVHMSMYLYIWLLLPGCSAVDVCIEDGDAYICTCTCVSVCMFVVCAVGGRGPWLLRFESSSWTGWFSK